MKNLKTIENILDALRYIHSLLKDQEDYCVIYSSIVAKFKLPGEFLSVCCVMNILERNNEKRPYKYKWIAGKPDQKMAEMIHYREKIENLSYNETTSGEATDESDINSPEKKNTVNDNSVDKVPFDKSVKQALIALPDDLSERIARLVELYEKGYKITIHAVPPQPMEIIF